MARDARFTVLFRAAGGPRVGFGHLVRCRSLARALGVEPIVSVRGSAQTCATARTLGLRVVDAIGDEAIRLTQPRVLVVDDPSADDALAWVKRARRLGIPVAAVHDLGLGYVPADLGVDGSILPRTSMQGRCGDLKGPSYAILDPGLVNARERSTPCAASRVLIALGGGAHVYACATHLARAIAARWPGVEIR